MSLEEALEEPQIPQGPQAPPPSLEDYPLEYAVLPSSMALSCPSEAHSLGPRPIIAYPIAKCLQTCLSELMSYGALPP